MAILTYTENPFSAGDRKKTGHMGNYDLKTGTPKKVFKEAGEKCGLKIKFGRAYYIIDSGEKVWYKGHYALFVLDRKPTGDLSEFWAEVRRLKESL